MSGIEYVAICTVGCVILRVFEFKMEMQYYLLFSLDIQRCRVYIVIQKRGRAYSR